jgi:hypothetical protein
MLPGSRKPIRLTKKSNKIVKNVELFIAYLGYPDTVKLKKGDRRAFYEQASQRFEYLKESLPSLFHMLIDMDYPDTFEMYRLKEMLATKDLIDAKQVKYETANEQMGQRYFDEFVAPNVDMTKEAESNVESAE